MLFKTLFFALEYANRNWLAHFSNPQRSHFSRSKTRVVDSTNFLSPLPNVGHTGATASVHPGVYSLSFRGWMCGNSESRSSVHKVYSVVSCPNIYRYQYALIDQHLHMIFFWFRTPETATKDILVISMGPNMKPANRVHFKWHFLQDSALPLTGATLQVGQEALR